jgi:ABC-type transport system substrate-binding protein
MLFLKHNFHMENLKRYSSIIIRVNKNGDKKMEKSQKRLFSLLVFSLLLVLLPATFSAPEVYGEVEPTIPRGEIFATNGGFVDNLNPYNTASRNAAFGPYQSLAYADTLSGMIKPLLAESWDWVDDYTFEIKIQPQAHWSDGTPVTADDVVFSLDTLSDPTYGGARLAVVSSYTVHDSKTVWIILNQDYPHNSRVMSVFINNGQTGLGVIIPKARWSALLTQYGSDIVSYTDIDDLSAIITSFPYLPYYLSPDHTRFIQIRDDNYWGNALGWFHCPKYIELIYYATNEEVVRGGYEGREVDFSGVGFNEPQWYKDHSEYMSCWDITASPENMFFHEPCCLVITPNYNYSVDGVYVFRYQWLRQALSYACDAATSLEQGWSYCGNLYPPTFLNPDLATYDIYVNETAITANFETANKGGHLGVPYDPDKAIEILQQYCDGSVTEGWTIKGTNVKLGYPTWTIQAVNGWTDTNIEVKTFAQDWTDIGIPTEPVYPEFGTWMSNYETGNFIWTQMWSWIRLSETANPVADTFYDNFVLMPTTISIWSGSPGSYPLFFDGNHLPLPNTAGEVKDLVLSLYQMDSTSDEFIATVKKLQEILIPQVPFIMPHGKSSTQAFVTDRWVNWPTAQNPFEHRLDSVGPSYSLLIKHVKPKCITTTSFTLSQGLVEAGTPVIASVTLVNSADYEQKYQVEIREGTATAGSQETHPLLAFKVATVPARGSVTVPLTLTINATGTHVLTVDDWRFNEAETQHTPGVPLEVQLIVTEKQMYSTKDILDAATAAKNAADDAKTAANNAVAAANAAVTAANNAVAAANNAAPVWMVWASAIITIVVVLVGEYVMTRRLKA